MQESLNMKIARILLTLFFISLVIIGIVKGLTISINGIDEFVSSYGTRDKQIESVFKEFNN